MTGSPAAAVPSRAWNWPARLGAYLLLQAAIVAACVLVLGLPLPVPPAGYGQSEARLEGLTVGLPYGISGRPGTETALTFSMSFDRPPEAAAEPWSVLVPRFVNAIEIGINGSFILDSRRDPAANRPDRNTPIIAVIPTVLLRDGANELMVRLHVWGPLSGFLDRIYVGPDQALRPAYDRRVLLFRTLPVVFAAWQAMLAVLIGVMWLNRRHEIAYGIFAAAMALGTLQAFVPAPMQQQSLEAAIQAVLLASAPLEAACILVFVLAFFGLVRTRLVWLVFLPGLLVAMLGLLGGAEAVRDAYLLITPPTVLLALVTVGITCGWIAVTRREGVAALLGSAVTIVIAFSVNDFLSALGVAGHAPILVSRLSYSALLVAIGIGLTQRFANALNEVDGFASRLVTQVREAENKLRVGMELEEQRARAAALAAERTRLMRDLHDGLGGQLVSIVALSERGGPGSESIVGAARAALRDLRLVIDAMDDIDGDLMLVLGAWRERTAAQLRPLGLALEWRASTPGGLPIHPELRPWHVIQVLRLLDEAVTNAARHAGASRIAVAIETVEEEPGARRGRITIDDDGTGFDVDRHLRAPGASKAARGLINMQRRAARCGATLAFQSGPAGTRVLLDLPRVFPPVEPG